MCFFHDRWRPSPVWPAPALVPWRWPWSGSGRRRQTGRPSGKTSPTSSTTPTSSTPHATTEFRVSASFIGAIVWTLFWQARSLPSKKAICKLWHYMAKDISCLDSSSWLFPDEVLSSRDEFFPKRFSSLLPWWKLWLLSSQNSEHLSKRRPACFCLLLPIAPQGRRTIVDT